MPYATRKMVQYMKEHGMSSVDESSAAGSGSTVVSSAEDRVGKKKIRELPSSVDPADDDSSGKKKKSADGGGSKTGKPKSASSSAGSTKSSSGGSKSSKTKSAASATDSKASSSKSAASSTSASSAKASATKSSTGRSKKKSSSGQSVKPKKSRVIQATSMALRPVVVSGMNYDDMSFDQKRVQFIQTLLKSNVSKLREINASESYENAKKAFSNYSVEEKKPLQRKPHSAKALYECTHQNFPKDCLVVAKVYDAKASGFDAKKSLFLKVLRHLGKKHPRIIQTWDVIAKDGAIYVFQELAPYGNMVDYTSKKGTLQEAETQEVAKQVRLAMDFLGDMGVAHRAIAPRHVLMMHKDFRVKLTGFREAIVYYDVKRDDINYQSCISLNKKGKGDYQAPEVYGNAKKEEFDPISADVWSAGATLYHLLTAKYPYDDSKNNPKIENEIQSNVRALKIADNAKSALGFMLTTESTKRFSVDRLKEHPWFHEK